tara:strand:+ start:13345 stop:15240 length:1896 start_codon:yes stop_codon:yes gene_type:complete
MATERRSIEISYKADLKDLLSKLKSMPNVTAKEAKAMVGELNKQLKKAEAAAKKTGQAMKKAGQQGATGFKSAENALRDFKSAGDDAEDKLEGVADKTGEADRGFMSMGMALNHVNPALGESIMLASDMAAVSEGLLLTFKNLPKTWLGAGVAIAALTVAYSAYQEAAEKARQKTIAIRLAEKEHADVLKIAKENLDKAKLSFSDINDELLVYQGRLSESTLELKRLTRATREQFSTADIQARVKALKEDAALVQLAGKNIKLLSDAEKERLDTLMQQTRGIKEQNFLNIDGEKRIKNLQLIMADINTKLEEEENNRRAIAAESAKAIEAATELFNLQEKDRIAQEKAAQSTERAAKNKAAADKEAAEQAAREQEEIEELIEASRAENELLERKQELKGMFISLTESENDKAIRGINERADLEKQKARELATQTEEYNLALETIHEIEKARIKELSELKKKDAKEHAQFLIGSISTIADISLQAIDKENKEREQAAIALFRLQQAASIANIAMTTAENINKYTGAGPLAPFLVGVAIATGSAQAAAVAAQPPPSFHMGGLAPDERRAVLLSGEAVLDRTTTRSLGGPEGVRRLQNGGGAGEIIIMQPFKHFDRYNRSARKRAGRPLGSAGY